MPDTFFNDDNTQETNQETDEAPEKVKVGEEEYSQEELSKLVGLGKLAAEAEDKYSTSIDKVWPAYTRTTQENAELKRQLEEAKRAERTIDNSTLTSDQKEVARRTLYDIIGGEPLTKAEFDEAVDKKVSLRLQAKELLDDIQVTVSEMEEQGLPKTNTDDLLRHMSETGIKNPRKAYKDMFEEELDKIKEAKLQSLKQPGLVTESGSTAGAKQPPTVNITDSNISELLREALKGQG